MEIHGNKIIFIYFNPLIKKKQNRASAIFEGFLLKSSTLSYDYGFFSLYFLFLFYFFSVFYYYIFILFLFLFFYYFIFFYFIFFRLDNVLDLWRNNLNKAGHNLDNSERTKEWLGEASKKLFKFHSKEKLNQFETSNGESQTYQLPDGTTLNLNDKLISDPLRGLENTKELNLKYPGIFETAFNSIMQSEIDTRKDCFANIVVSGGVSLIDGFVPVFKERILDLAPSSISTSVGVSVPLGGAWVGGSIEASVIHNQAVTSQNYKEYGPPAINFRYPEGA